MARSLSHTAFQQDLIIPASGHNMHIYLKQEEHYILQSLMMKP